MDALQHLFLKLFAFQHGVAAFFLAVMACVAWRQLKPSQAPNAFAASFIPLFPMAFLVVTLVSMGTYLAFPSFSDHVESSVVVLGYRLLHGDPIYPTVVDHTLSGLLYSPLLFEINAAALALPLPPELSTKLPALLAYLGALLACVFSWPDRRAWLYLLIIGPFAQVFINSGQPFLLLGTSLALLALTRMRPSMGQAFVVGGLAGACMGIKLHGLLYVAALYLVMVPSWWVSPLRLVAIVVGAASVFLLTFLPAGVSLQGFWHFIEMATNHGLVRRILLENLFFVFVLWLPLLIMRVWQEGSRKWPVPVSNMLLLLGVEVLVAAIGSKKGAGSWHLLPFVIVHGQMFSSILPGLSQATLARMVPAFAVSLLATLVNAVPMSLGFAREWSTAAQAREELIQLVAEYPGLVIATGGEVGYEHIFQRIHLEQRGARQIDFPGYLDLQLAGVSDAVLADAMRTCEIPYIAAPLGEPAFHNESNYTKAPLFSDALREQFRSSYVRLRSTGLFDVYGCQSKAN